MPFDKPGFGVDSTPPAMPLNPANAFTYDGFFKEHVRHTPANLPRIAFERLRVIARDAWKNERMVLGPFVIVGLFALNGAIVFGLACSLASFVVYLIYVHRAGWTLSYVDALPILAVLAGLGLV